VRIKPSGLINVKVESQLSKPFIESRFKPLKAESVFKPLIESEIEAEQSKD